MNQSSNKIQLPVKTKIATIIGGLVGLYHLVTVEPLLGDYVFCVSSCYIHNFANRILFIIGFLLILNSIAIFFLKKYRCQTRRFFIMFILLVILIYAAADSLGNFTYYYPGLVALLASLFLLIIDRKNYFAAVERAKSAGEGHGGD